MRRIYFISYCVALVLLGVFVLWQSNTPDAPVPGGQEGVVDNTETQEGLLLSEPEMPPAVQENEHALVLFQQRESSKQIVREEDISVELIAEGAVYSSEVLEGSSIYEAMLQLVSTTPFRFNARYFNGLGYFIEEINGIKNKGGAYWTLYVNEEFAHSGASDYKVQAGDVIEWKFEKK